MMESPLSAMSEHQTKLASSVHLGTITATKGNGISGLKLSQLVENGAGAVGVTVDGSPTDPSATVAVNLVDALQHDDNNNNNNHKQIYIHLNELTDDDCPKIGSGQANAIYSRLAAAAVANSNGVVSVLSAPTNGNDHNGTMLDGQPLKIIVQNGTNTIDMSDANKNGSLLLNMNGQQQTDQSQQLHLNQQHPQHHLVHSTIQQSQQSQQQQQTLVNGQAQQQHLYDYYKLPVMVDGTTKAITLVTPDGKSVVAAPDGTLQEMVWSAVPVSVSSAGDVVHGAATIVASNGSLSSSPNRPSEDDHPCSTNGGRNTAVSNSPTDHHHNSPTCLIKIESNDDPHQIILTTATTESTDAISATTGSTVLHLEQQQDSADNSGASVLHPCEVHIKSENLDTLPQLSSPAQMTLDVLQPASVDRTRELEASPPATVISLAPAAAYPTASANGVLNAATNGPTGVQSAQLTFAPGPATYDLSGNAQYVHVNPTTVSPQYNTPNGVVRQNGSTVYVTGDYMAYREYLPNGAGSTTDGQNTIVFTQDAQGQYRQQLVPSPVSGNAYTTAASTQDTDGGFLDRYLRQPNGSLVPAGVIATSVSPTAMAVSDATGMSAGRPENAKHTQVFDYGAIVPQSQSIQSDMNSEQSPNGLVVVSPSITPAPLVKGSSRRSWHDYSRNAEVDKVHIPKLTSDVGLKYFLESPISTSARREDDRVTYINKGQFYGITLEYLPDLTKPLKTNTVKSVVMLVFREEKLPDEELKAWQFWHSRQHSVKQRILDADTKNSSGIIGQIEELSHNAITFFWNPHEATAKVNIAVQCLSTDFSNQKGVKGLPLHLQVDTFDDMRDGAQPIHRGYAQIKVFCDKGAERKTRDEERRANKRKLAGNGRKKMEDMYHQSTDRSEFYSMAELHKPATLFSPSDDMEKLKRSSYDSDTHRPDSLFQLNTGDLSGFYGHSDIGDRDLCDLVTPPKKLKVERYPSTNERVLLYAKQQNEQHFHPLHISPPTLVGLALAIENKYKLEAKNIRNIYKRNIKGITLQMDDDMVRYFAHEDIVLLEVHQINNETHDITLVEFEPC